MNWTRAQLFKMRRNIHLAATSLPDETAVETPELFEGWMPDTEYKAGDRRQWAGRLFKCRQDHTSLEIYPPDTVPALWEEIPKPGQGDSPDNPIPYNNNMALEKDKYYSQDGVVYVCTRDSGQAMTHPLSELVGFYVEVWTG